MSAAEGIEPPGPGAWFLDTSHLTTSCSRYHQPLWMDGFPRGFSECLRRYGSLLESLDWAWVDGFPYYRITPVAAPEGATEHPPREIWDELMATHPDVQERLVNAERAFETRIWREEIAHWDAVDKPNALAEHRRLLSIDPSELDRRGVVDYLEACTENVRRGVYLHHVYNMAAFIPAGDLIAQGTEMTGWGEAEILSLLRGSTPDALGVGHLRERLRQAAAKSQIARLLESDDAEAALAEIETLEGEEADVLREVVAFIAYRPVNGEDVGDTCVFELPELVLGGILAELDAPADGGEEEASELRERTAAARAAVDQRRRASFDEVLAEARFAYRIREERAMYGDLWSYGVARRALLAAGAGLAASGRIEGEAHLVEASLPEIRAILAGDGGPERGQLAERARYRAEVSYDAMPPQLGDPPGAPLPVEWLPASSARMEMALGAAIGALFGPPEAAEPSTEIEGLGVSGGVVEGPARVIDASLDFSRIRSGDVLVTRATTAGFNVVLPLLSGIVTDRGGLLCHAAVVSREYSIPAVVGTGDATGRIPDGARVRVDGTAGTVTVLS